MRDMDTLEKSFAEASTLKADESGISAIVGKLDIPDRMGEIIKAGALGEKQPVIMSGWNHASSRGPAMPVGTGTVEEIDGDIVFTGDTLDKDAPVKTMLKSLGAAGKWSVGFRVLKDSMVDGNRNYDKIQVYEVSPVSSPAQPATSTLIVKDDAMSTDTDQAVYTRDEVDKMLDAVRSDVAKEFDAFKDDATPDVDHDLRVAKGRLAGMSYVDLGLVNHFLPHMDDWSRRYIQEDVEKALAQKGVTERHLIDFYDAVAKDIDDSSMVDLETRDAVEKAQATSTSISEFVPNILSAQVWRGIQDNFTFSRRVPIFPMRTNSVKVPRSLTTNNLQTRSEGGQAGEATLDASEVSVSTNLYGMRVPVTDELQRWSAVTPGVMQQVRQLFQYTTARDLERIYMSGDTETTAASNVNNETGGGFKGSADGLRKRTLVTLANGLSAKTSTNDFSAWNSTNDETYGVARFIAALTSMGKYADQLSSLQAVVDRIAFWSLMKVKEFRTQDMVGRASTLTSGRVPDLFGVPTVQSASIPATDDDNGYVDGTAANNTFGTILIFRPSQYRRPFEQGVRLVSSRDESRALTNVYLRVSAGGITSFNTSSDQDVIALYGVN